MTNDVTHYSVDGSFMSLREMRTIIDTVLGHGNMAYHYPVSTIIKILQEDGRVVTVFRPHF